ncbi:MAG: uL15 family ribosomal protein, partial [Synergistaceae bacterium]|nr:uL15 family ribosomal protein [Synergistaceae bacterium]
QIVNLDALDKKFEAGAEVDQQAMFEARVIRKKNIPVKVLSDGELKKALKIKAGAFSKEAAKKIEAAGGTHEVV